MKNIAFPGLLALLLATSAAYGQMQTMPVAPAAGRAYQFMQVTVLEGAPGYVSFSPEFKAQKVVKLEEVYMNQLYNDKMRLKLQANEDKVMQSLQEITAAGWELVQVSTLPLPQADGRPVTQTRYLFRQAK